MSGQSISPYLSVVNLAEHAFNLLQRTKSTRLRRLASLTVEPSAANASLLRAWAKTQRERWI